MYNSKVLNLFTNPENAGRISKPDGIADIYNEDNTAHVEFSIRVEDGVVTACKFRAQANPYIIAVCSTITKMAINKPFDAMFIDKAEIIASLGENLDINIDFCLQCLNLAIEDYIEKQAKSKK